MQSQLSASISHRPSVQSCLVALSGLTSLNATFFSCLHKTSCAIKAQSVCCVGVVGAIDGSHIHIKAPHQNSSAHVNRKGVHSIVLQAFCTSDMWFTDCHAGEVGSVNDATVFNIALKCPKSHRCEEREAFKMNQNCTHDEISKHSQHVQSKISTKQQQDSDQQISNGVTVICIELENVLSLPRADVSSFFYQRKLNVYNITVHMVSEWVCRFLTAHQHMKGYSVPCNG